MSEENLKHQGRLAVKELEAKRLALLIKGQLDAIRDALDPFAPLTELRCDLAAAQAVQLAGQHAEYLGLLGEIKAIKRALGI